MKMTSPALALSALSALAASLGCGSGSAGVGAVAGDDEQAIINGDFCAAGQDPTAVALLVDATLDCPAFGGSFDFTAVQCTGTLIAPDVVLLAAHCVDPGVIEAQTGGNCTQPRADFYISFDDDLSAFASQQQEPLPIPANAVPVREAVFHPQFDINGLSTVGTDGKENDVALLFLDVAVDGVRPEIVITKEEATQLSNGTSVEIAGWGQQTQTGPQEQPPAGSIGIKQCGASTIDELGDTLMQVGADPASVRKCHGDSGGPTYVDVETSSSIKRRVIGITSRAYDEQDCAKGGVDTRVDAFLDFIDGEMTARCADGSRVFCDVDGIIPASFFDDENGGDEGEGEDNGRANPDNVDPAAANCPGGCGQNPVDAGLVGGLGLLLLVRRRRLRA